MKTDPQQPIYIRLQETGNELAVTKCNGNIFPSVQSELKVSFIKAITSANADS